MDLSRYNKPVNLSGPSNFFNNMSARATSTSQMVLQHGMNMEAAHHGNELAKDYATHAGNIQSGLSAQEHSQTSALSAQEHNQRQKESGAVRRHEIKKIVLGHNNDLEKAAVEHHLLTDKLRTESGLRVTEANNTSKNTVAEAGVAHKHAGDLLNRIAAAGQGGTDVSFKHGNVSANFTLKTPPSPATNPTPTAAPASKLSPRKELKIVAKPAEAPKGPQPSVKRGPNGRIMSLKDTASAAPAKKAPAKKAAPAKGQPTVTRDPKTGRMIGIKKK